MSGLNNAGKDAVCTAVAPVFTGGSHEYKTAAAVVIAIISAITIVLDSVNHRLKNSGAYTGPVTASGTVTNVDVKNSSGTVLANLTAGETADNAQITMSTKDLNAGDLVSLSDGQYTQTFS